MVWSHDMCFWRNVFEDQVRVSPSSLRHFHVALLLTLLLAITTLSVYLAPVALPQIPVEEAAALLLPAAQERQVG